MLVYFGQLTHRTNNINQNRRMPLACGFLASYLSNKIGDEFEFDIFKTPDTLNNALVSQKPDVLMLSNYMWNESLVCTFANRVKEVYDNVLVIVGGPNLSLNENTNIQLLKDNPAIDKLVLHEGEIPSFLILKEFLKHRDVEKIRTTVHPSSISFNKGKIFGGSRSTNSIKSIGVEETRLGMKGSEEDLDAISSPYLSGYFDKFFDNGEVPLIETNRGCPFKCTFCQQGKDYFAKVRNFDIKRICDEIEYIAKKIHSSGAKIDTMCIADPNFAMYKRDGTILDTIRKTQDLYGYPKNVICSTGKNKPELIIENTSKLELGSILLRSAVQSLDDKTLKAIDRSNIKLEAYAKIQDEMTQMGLESEADLMMGLPCETRDAHCNGIYKLVDSGVKEIACLQTIKLKGTVLEEDSYVKKYGIKSKKRVLPSCYGTYQILGKEIEAVEFDEIIVGNDDLSFNDYLSCRKLHLIIMIFHNTRLLQPTYLYLDHYKINRSEIIKSLYHSNDKGLVEILNQFLEATKDELVDNISDIKKMSKSFEEITSNKIFRSLSISLYFKKKEIKQAMHKALNKVITDSMDSNSEIQNEILDIIHLFNESVISPFGNFEEEVKLKAKSKVIADIFGSTIILGLTEKQLTMLTTLNKIFSDRESKINSMAYHLKPANLSRIILSSDILTKLGDSREYIVQ